MAKNNDFTWYEKNLIVSALAVSVMARFEGSRLEILLDFVLANEEKVWQTAFIGLVLGINGRENKLTFAENQTLAQHLNELLEIERIQKALIDTTEILREKSFEGDIIKKKLLAQHYSKYDFFKKIEHWFLPFHQGHQVVQDLKNGDTQQPIDQEWLDLLESTSSLCDPDKYALCLHIDNYSASQITRFKEILQKEKRNLNLNTDYKDSIIIQKELSKFYQFYSSFSSEKLKIIAKGQEQLQATALPRMLMSELTKLRIQADEYYSINNYAQAIPLYEAYLKYATHDHQVWFRIGYLYDDKGEKDKAIECYEKTVKIKPDYHEAWNNMGNAYDDKGEKKAIECYEKAIEIKPDYHEAWMNLGFLYLEFRALVLAQEKTEQAIQLGSIDFGNMNMGHICLAQNKEEKALRHYEIALQNFSSKETFFEGMADDFQYLQQYGISVAYYQSIIEQLKQS